MAIYQKAKQFRILDSVNFQVKEIYSAYRSGGLEVNGKFVGKSFYPFNEEGKTVFKEKFWNADERKFDFRPYDGKLDKEFYKTYKKVFDVHVVLGEDVTLPVWDKEQKKEVDTVVAKGNEVVFQAISASKVKTMIEDLDLDEGIKLVEGTDKAGEKAMVKPFDWEDEYKDKLKEQFITMKVRGTGMDTKYKFKQGKPFKMEEDDKFAINLDDIPF